MTRHVTDPAIAVTMDHADAHLLCYALDFLAADLRSRADALRVFGGPDRNPYWSQAAHAARLADHLRAAGHR